MEKVNGERRQKNKIQPMLALNHCACVTSLKVNIAGTRKTVMGSSIGRVATCTRAPILKMSGKASERCTGLTAIYSEVIGLTGSRTGLVS